jgi:hypothetical protein
VKGEARNFLTYYNLLYQSVCLEGLTKTNKEINIQLNKAIKERKNGREEGSERKRS